MSRGAMPHSGPGSAAVEAIDLVKLVLPGSLIVLMAIGVNGFYRRRD